MGKRSNKNSAWKRDVHAASSGGIRVEETEHPAESELL